MVQTLVGSSPKTESFQYGCTIPSEHMRGNNKRGNYADNADEEGQKKQKRLLKARGTRGLDTNSELWNA